MTHFHYSHWYFRMPWMRKYDAMCLGRHVLFRFGKDAVSCRLMNHEMIHQ